MALASALLWSPLPLSRRSLRILECTIFGMIAAFFAWTARRPRVAVAIGAITAALVALSLIQTWQYWTGIIPAEKTTWAQYRALFLRLR